LYLQVLISILSPSVSTPCIICFFISFFFIYPPQGLTGTDAATLTASAVSISTLKTTIAGTMGLTADNIVTFSVVDYCTGCRRQLSWSSFNPLASTAVVTMTYVVSATSVYSADNLYLRLDDAIYSGAFNTDLYNNAQAAGATGLYGCSSAFASYTIDWDDDSIDKLNGGAIAGIVIGVLAFVAIVGGLIFYCFCRRRRKYLVFLPLFACFPSTFFLRLIAWIFLIYILKFLQLLRPCPVTVPSRRWSLTTRLKGIGFYVYDFAREGGVFLLMIRYA